VLEPPLKSFYRFDGHCIRKRDSLSEDEIKCKACNGTGFEVVKQPSEPGKKVYAARCKVCGGKGWVKKPEK
jgi:DnaJ-class molecular chaperone